jgi:carboxylate-amine ligase
MRNEIDLNLAEEIFDGSTDATVGLEEEFAIVDRDTLDLVPAFERLRDAAAGHPILSESIAGELIKSEIEIRSGPGRNLADARSRQQVRRADLFRLAESEGVALAASGTHPWADYRDQQIIDTEHYRRVEDDLRWVAWRNNTFSLHVHVGINGVDRAVRVTDRLRPLLPWILALSSSSPFLDGRDSGLHSVRSQIFTKSFPRCGVPEAFGSWERFRSYIELLVRANSIVEYTQVWWSVRPHLSFGTVEVRIADAQPTAESGDSLAGLIVACVLQAAREEDEGRPAVDLPTGLIEENMWRAIRYGLDGKMIDFESGNEIASSSLGDRLLEWTAPVRKEHGIDLVLPEISSAQAQRAELADGRTVREVYGDLVKRTAASYAGEAAYD